MTRFFFSHNEKGPPKEEISQCRGAASLYEDTHTHTHTYMSLLVQLVISELELVKVDDSVHPVRAKVGGVRVHIETCRRTLLFKTPHPHGVLVLIAILVYWCHIHEQDVSGVGIQVKQLNFEWRKHPPKVRNSMRN